MSISFQKPVHDIEYPESDGQPMGETPLHRKNMANLIETLDWLHERDPRVYVSGNMFLYYAEGQPKKSVVPDVFLVKGVPKLPERRVYKTWIEGGKAPDFIVEVTWRSTQEEDEEGKFELYRDVLEVAEYFLFDPESDYLDPPLRGFRRVEGEYRPIVAVEGRLPSEVLGLHLEADGWEVRLFDPETGRRVPTPRERGDRADRAVAQAEAERKRADREAKRASREAKKAVKEAKRAEDERKRAEDERKRAEEERKRAEELGLRAEVEARGRAEAEAEIERLRRLLDQANQGGKPPRHRG